MLYSEFKSRQSKEFENFPIFFAFNQTQLIDGLVKLSVSKTDIISIGVGGFIKKSDADNFNMLVEKLVREKENAFKDKDFLTDAIFYELQNHEYCITLDPTPALDSLGIVLDNNFKKYCFASALCRLSRDPLTDESELYNGY